MLITEKKKTTFLRDINQDNNTPTEEASTALAVIHSIITLGPNFLPVVE